jgi:hypothetical protein
MAIRLNELIFYNIIMLAQYIFFLKWSMDLL